MKDWQGTSAGGPGLNRLSVSAFIFGIGITVYGLNPDYLLNGDAVYYANFIRNSQFDTLTLHDGYYFIAWISLRILNLVVPVGLDELLVYLNMLFGAAGLVITFWLADDLLDDRRQAAMTALVLLLCGRYFINATSAEIYVQQMFFVLMSFHLFLNRRFLPSGLAAVAALFITPLSVFAFLFFPVVFFSRRYTCRDMLPFVLPFIFIYGLFFALVYRELLFGTRGLLIIADVKKFRPELAVMNFVKYQVKHYSVLIIPALLGCIVLYRKPFLFRVTLAVCIPHFYLISKLTAEDHVFLMITDFFFALLVTLGLTLIATQKSGRAIALLLITLHAGLLIYTAPLFSGEDRKLYGQEMQQVFKQYVKDKDAVVITDWGQRMALSYFNSTADGRPLESGEAYDKTVDEANLTDSLPQLKNFSGKVYVMDNYEVGGMTRLLLSETELDERHNRYSLWTKVRDTLKTDCSPVLSGIRTLYECQWPPP